MSIDEKTVNHVAELACLSLTETETKQMAVDLAAIVLQVNELNELDTSNVEPMSHVSLLASKAQSSWREDTVLPGVSHDDALAQAPRTAQGGFAVPAFVGEG